MQELLGEEYELYIESLSKSVHSGLRVNTLKISVEEFTNLPMERAGAMREDAVATGFVLENASGECEDAIKARPVQTTQKLHWEAIPWIDTGFYVSEGMRPSKSAYYYAGLYYLQEPSAMTPAMISKVKKGDRVLDLCAAPGGKSTQLGCMLGGEGVLVSNDLSNSRAKALLKNLEMSGVGNVYITCEEPAKLATVYEEYFDTVLVDAPCSGEGMFRKDLAVFKAYLTRGSEYFVPIQKEILRHAAKMVKPNGYLVYSTCTYSVLEDEEVLMDFLKKHKDFEIDAIEEYKDFTDSKLLPGTKRLLPHKLQGEGHFISRLRKKGLCEADCDGDESVSHENVLQENTSQRNTAHEHVSQKDASQMRVSRKDASQKASGFRTSAKLPSCVNDFLGHLDIDFDSRRFYVNREYVYYLPEDNYVAGGLRYLRTGLLLGRVNKERFEPSQALAMFLKKEQWDCVLDLSINDIRVEKYLKGETLEILNEDEITVHFRKQNKDDGYRLVCVDSYPLGFAKQSGMRLKNKYYAGWRMN